MPEYTVCFAGAHVSIQYDTDELYRFLSLLFDDVCGVPVADPEIHLFITLDESTGEYTLNSTACAPFSGSLGVQFAAVLFDAVIFNLLNKNSHGIAFHAGAVAWQEKVILLPGQSGYGKSSMTTCLLTHGFSYLTDELYFIPVNENAPMLPFTRPLCIKPDTTTAVSQLISERALSTAIADKDGLVIPHRSLNPDFLPISSPPSLILLPRYLAGSTLKIDKISAAQVCTLLMTCDVNARNLADHGFQQIVQFARSTPAYQITYSSFKGINDALRDLFDALHWE